MDRTNRQLVGNFVTWLLLGLAGAAFLSNDPHSTTGWTLIAVGLCLAIGQGIVPGLLAYLPASRTDDQPTFPRN